MVTCLTTDPRNLKLIKRQICILRFLRALSVGKRLVLVAAMVLAIVLPRDGLSLVLHDENCYLFYAANFQLNLFTTTNTPLYLSEMYKMHPN